MPFKIVQSGVGLQASVGISKVIEGNRKLGPGLTCAPDWLLDPGNLIGWLDFIREHKTDADGPDETLILMELLPEHKQEIKKVLDRIAKANLQMQPESTGRRRSEELEPFDDDDEEEDNVQASD